MDPIVKNPPGTQGLSAEGALIKDGSTASFVADVIEGSRDTPVIVDFWAPWCGPCKQLGPALERAVQAAKGAVRLVKINIDENQELAREMHVQSIPAVYAFVQGRPVDGFLGSIPESQVKTFVERLVKAGGGSAAEALAEAMAQADELLAAGDIATAEDIYSHIADAEPSHAGAHAGMVRARLAADDAGGARAVLDRVPADVANAPEIAAARSALELAEQRPGKGVLGEAEAKLAANPGDHQARFDYANALFADGRQEEAVDQLIESIKRDRSWNEQAARKQLLKLFEALGPTHTVTVAGRRKLSSVLFA